MTNTESKIEENMGLGYTINIECKGKGRDYEMTYEAKAYKSVPLGSTKGEMTKAMAMHHAFGESINEVTEKIIRSIDN